MPARLFPIIGVNKLIEQLKNSTSVFRDPTALNNAFENDNMKRLEFLVPEKFLGYSKRQLQDSASMLSNLMTATSNNNGVVAVRTSIAKSIARDFESFVSLRNPAFDKLFAAPNLDSNFSLSSLPSIEQALLSKPALYIDTAKANTKAETIAELKQKDVTMDLVRKSLLYLFHKKDYSSFFWWLFLFALLQDAFVLLQSKMPLTQYQQISATLDSFGYSLPLNSSICLNSDSFWELRRDLIRTARGHLFIAGPSLRDAFSYSHSHSVVKELQFAIRHQQLERISVFLTDPGVFDQVPPMRDVNEAVQCLQESFYDLVESHSCTLHIYLLALPQIDHAVITDEFMAFRSNKLWNSDRRFKGDFTLHLADYYTNPPSYEYEAHRDYLSTIAENSTSIYPDVDKPITPPAPNTALWYHALWRDYLEKNSCQHVFLHKLYEQQIASFATSTWSGDDVIGEVTPSPNMPLVDYSDFFDAENLLADESQSVLLSHIKQTEVLFNRAIEKHGHPGNKSGYCHIFPSLDLGFPNNVQRLAGGFATGMLIVWKCGVDIVPVDATVNVCTSSVFKLNSASIPETWLDSKDGLKCFCEDIRTLSKRASEQKGYSFAFNSGNHFLMIAQEQGTEDYYLVMHSSANELKKSYMGLYPVEGNWYSDKIKTVYNDEHTRYFRYLKDADARYFIQMAHNFQGYNEQIHQWIAEEINGGLLARDNDNSTRWMYHHYYMPTDQSIAIGVFAEPAGTQVPMFSAFGKPVYIFEIGNDNWKVNLGGSKGRVCLVPHGWGQEIRHIKNISIRNADLPEKRELILETLNKKVSISVNSHERIACEGKGIRDFKDGEEFLGIGNRYVHGKILKTLVPVVEYSAHTAPRDEE